MAMGKVAVVTGGNRGLGRETARQLLARGWRVVVTARDLAAGQLAARELHRETGGDVIAADLDVRCSEQALQLAGLVRERLGRLDALVNNAGAIYEGGEGVLGVDPELVLRTFETNTLGAMRVTQALAPLMIASGGGNVVNVSSGMGGIAEMDGGWPAYRVSKAALNALTRLMHVELHAKGLRVNAVCPGWVRTEMGGPDAARDPSEGASGIVWAATLEDGGPSGGFFRDGEPLAW